MKTGIALSGGGARGIAHIGVLKALEELNIKPDVISGVSAGAVVGAFYAAGFTTIQILNIAANTSMFSITDFSFNKPGLFKMESLKQLLQRYLNNLTFEKLNIPFVVTATDFVKCEPVYFSEGELIQPLLASSAIPVMFQPVKYRDKFLVDGGILNNLPVEPLFARCEKIIGVHVNPIDKTSSDFNLLTVIDRVVRIATENTVIPKKHLCNIFIEPPQLAPYGIFDVDKAKDIATAGYDYTMSLRNEIVDALAK